MDKAEAEAAAKKQASSSSSSSSSSNSSSSDTDKAKAGEPDLQRKVVEEATALLVECAKINDIMMGFDIAAMPWLMPWEEGRDEM